MEMDNKTYLAVITCLAILIIGFAYLNLKHSSAAQLSEDSSEIDESCKSLDYKGNDRVDLLFFGSEADTKRFSEALLGSDPYKEYRDYFNVFFIDDYEVTCEKYKNIAIVCKSKDLARASDNCPNDYIIVIKDESPNIRSSALGNVISLNKNHDNSVILHEFGHSFANLAEEYVPANVPRGSENCLSSCNDFEQPTDSCDLGCSEIERYRSINAGVMRTLSTSDYGQYNDRLIRALLDKNKPSESSISGNVISQYEECSDKYTILKGSADNLEGLEVTPTNTLNTGCYPQESGAGEYYTSSANGEEYYFSTTLFTDAQSDSEDIIEGKTFQGEEFILSIPVSGAQEVKIYESITQNLVAVISLDKTGAVACTQ